MQGKAHPSGSDKQRHTIEKRSADQQHFNQTLLAVKHKNRLKVEANVSIIRYNCLRQGEQEMLRDSRMGVIKCERSRLQRADTNSGGREC